ncbi:MAG: CapA family protein, partial [Clostridia bacterium]
MSKKLLSWFLVLSMCLTLCALSIAEEDNEEVSITIFDKDGEAATDDVAPTPAPVDKSAPVHQADGSILITMSFTGDVTIGGNTQASGTSIFEKELKKQKGDINFPFRNVKAILETDDLTMVNFESTLTSSGKNRDKLENDYLFRADPSYVQMLLDNGIESVSLENNHVLDMGEEGLAETKRTLSNA